MKYVIILFLSFVLNFSYGQLEFAPIGAKWTYETTIYPIFGGKINLITIFESIQDTIINQKKCRLLKRYEISKDKNGNLQNPYFYSPAVIFQNGDKIFQLFRDSFYLLYDWSLKSGDSIELQGEIYPNESLSLRYLTKIKSNIIDAKFGFSIRKINQDMICHGKLGRIDNVIQFEKFGMIENSLFYIGEFCGIDYDTKFHLRCYQDDQVGLIKFDSISCDSIRTDNTQVTNEQNLIIYPTLVTNNLNLLIASNQINKLEVYSIKGMNVLNTKKSTDIVNNAIELSILDSGVYMLKIYLKNGSIRVNKFIKI